MGLDTTHDCWHGPYSMFMRWRVWLAGQVGIPLQLMEGFVDWIPDAGDIEWADHRWQDEHWQRWRMMVNAMTALKAAGGAIGWECLTNDPLHILLHHSDCEGTIRWYRCKAIALRLMEVYRRSAANDVRGHGSMDNRRGCYDSMRRATLRFALGCMRAYRARENVRFS